MALKIRFILGFVALLICGILLEKTKGAHHEDRICKLCKCDAKEKEEIWIYCAHKNLTSFPTVPYNTSVGGLFERLDIAFNRISAIRNVTFSNATALKELFLGSNHISSISEYSFKYLVLLEQLILTNNKIEIIPAHLFYQNLNIKKIVLLNNKIRTIPENLFYKSRSLSIVDIAKNEISKIPLRLFRYTSHLTWLDASNNQISDLSPNLFEHTPLLSYLDLHGNKLRTIHSNLFKKNFNIKYFNIGNNQILNLQPELFEKTREINVLNINKNNFTSIDPRIFYRMNALERLTTSGFTDCCNAKRVTGRKFKKCDYNENQNVDIQNCGVRLNQINVTYCKTFQPIHYGRVEIYDYKHAEWKILCSENWTKIDSDVLCRDLKFEDAIEYFPHQKITSGNLKIVSEDYICNGDEDYLMECPKKTLSKNCSQGIIIVRCKFEGEMLEKVCKASNYSVDCTKRDLSSMPWVNKTDEYAEVRRFNISGNKIAKIWRGTLVYFPVVKILDFSWNDIVTIPEKLFFYSGKLQTLNFSNNKIKHFPIKIFENLPNLVDLNLSMNQLTEFPSDIKGNGYVLKNLINLKILDLSWNHIVTIPEKLFFYSGKLQTLNFSNNKIKHFPIKIFENLPNLVDLDLSMNQLTEFPSDIKGNGYVLKNLINLKILNLSGNKITKLSTSRFKKLQILDISKMPTLIIQDWNFLHKLTKLETLKASKFDQCCFALREVPTLICEAPEDDFSDCDAMIKDPILLVILWIVMVFVIAANILAFFIRLVIPGNGNPSRILILNLIFSDFLMGVFLGGIVQKHYSAKNEYYLHDREWRQSNMCKAMGIIALLSSEISLGTLAAIAYVRYRSVVHAITEKTVHSHFARIILVVIWIFAVGVSVTPAFVETYFHDEETGNDFYGENAFCLPLQLPHENRTGWEYCFALFACVNLVVVCYIVILYGYMLYKLFLTKIDRVSHQNNEDIILTIRISMVILTDIFSWIPVIILLFLSLSRAVSDKEKEIYSWFVVVVFPLNSAINPLLYTLFSPRIWRKTKDALQSFSANICGSEDFNNGLRLNDQNYTSSYRSTQVINLALISPVFQDEEVVS